MACYPSAQHRRVKVKTKKKVVAKRNGSAPAAAFLCRIPGAWFNCSAVVRRQRTAAVLRNSSSRCRCETWFCAVAAVACGTPGHPRERVVVGSAKPSAHLKRQAAGIERRVDLAAVVTLGKCKVESMLSPVGICRWVASDLPADDDS